MNLERDVSIHVSERSRQTRECGVGRGGPDNPNQHSQLHDIGSKGRYVSLVFSPVLGADDGSRPSQRIASTLQEASGDSWDHKVCWEATDNYPDQRGRETAWSVSTGQKHRLLLCWELYRAASLVPEPLSGLCGSRVRMEHEIPLALWGALRACPEDRSCSYVGLMLLQEGSNEILLPLLTARGTV